MLEQIDQIYEIYIYGELDYFSEYYDKAFNAFTLISNPIQVLIGIPYHLQFNSAPIVSFKNSTINSSR